MSYFTFGTLRIFISKIFNTGLLLATGLQNDIVVFATFTSVINPTTPFDTITFTCDVDTSCDALPPPLHGAYQAHLTAPAGHKADPSGGLVELHSHAGPLAAQPAQVAGAQGVAGREAVVGLAA